MLASYGDDDHAEELLSKLVIDPSAVPHFTLQSGLLRYLNRIWVGNDLVLQQRLIAEFHSSAWGSFWCARFIYAPETMFCKEGYEDSCQRVCVVLFHLSTIQV